jgi:small subunit ribosomal protein S1
MTSKKSNATTTSKVATKKPRLADKVKENSVELNDLVEIKQRDFSKVDEDVRFDGDEWYLPDGTFDWEGYEDANRTRVGRNTNPHVKTIDKSDKVYCTGSYAQELYDLMFNKANANFPNKFDIDMGKVYEGTVYGITPTWISIDIGYRELIYVNSSKEDTQGYKEGDHVAVKITQGKQKDFITGSIEAGMQQAIFEELMNNIDGNVAYTGHVKHMIQEGGYIVNVNGIDCFMPGSLAGMNKLHDFSSIVGQDLYVVPISFSAERGTVVVSHRAYLKALVPNAIEDLRTSSDQMITGFVTGTAKFGVFCEFNGCLTGMIHINDLDETYALKLKKHEINPGDAIEFKVKEIISDTKITLTQLVHQDPWNGITERYKLPARVTGTVKSIKDYGMFVAVEEGVVGLLHISELPEGAIKNYSKGQEVTVEISRIEEITKKVFLKLIS